MPDRKQNLPPVALEDPMGPPPAPTVVRCLHCEKVYSSDEMVWRPDPRHPKTDGLWYCATPGCDGAGFRFDIHPVDRNYVDPRDQEEDEDLD